MVTLQKVIQQHETTGIKKQRVEKDFLTDPSTPHQQRTQEYVKEIRLRVLIDHECLYNEGRLSLMLLSETYKRI